jgi:hypothetical protein
MASIDRTAYPRFKSALTATELQALYRPTNEELRFTSNHARDDTGQLTLLTLIKCHQHLGYTPALANVPSQIRTYLSQQLNLPVDTKLEVEAEKLCTATASLFAPT